MARKKNTVKNQNTVLYGILVTPKLHAELKLAGSKKVRHYLPEIAKLINGEHLEIELNFKAMQENENS
jgi:hypothetical protein